MVGNGNFSRMNKYTHVLVNCKKKVSDRLFRRSRLTYFGYFLHARARECVCVCCLHIKNQNHSRGYRTAYPMWVYIFGRSHETNEGDKENSGKTKTGPERSHNPKKLGQKREHSPQQS